MSKLLIYIGVNQKFNQDEIRAVISSIEGVRNAKSGNFIGSVFECEYERSGKSTIIRVSPELETITVEGLDDIALDFCIKLQKRVQIALHVIDMDYSFNVALSDFNSVSDFRNAISV